MIDRILATIALALLSTGCMSIGTFNQLTPHDRGAVRLASSEPYGEGLRRTLDIYVPVGRPERAPVLIFFYGGGWSSGEKEDHSFVGDAFAAEGFVAVVPDYRIYPEVRFPGFVDDAAIAVQWVQANISQYGGDPSRIVLVGHSAGAHIAMLTALDPRYARAAGFRSSGIRGVVGLAGPYGFDNFDIPVLRNVFGAVDNPSTVMPIAFVRRSAPPVLLLHGDRDARVRLAAARVMQIAANEAGQDSDLRVYPGIDHPTILQALSVARRDEAPVLADTLRFARRVTGEHRAELATVGTGVPASGGALD